MSDYLLFGTKLIENDDTLKDFALSLCKGVPTDQIKDQLSETPKENYAECFKDSFLNLVDEIQRDDLSRTDIDYSALLYKYRKELGDLLYEIDNHHGDTESIHFFGDESERSFNSLVFDYIDIHFDELLEELNPKPIAAVDIIKKKIAHLETKRLTECYFGPPEASAQIRILKEVLKEIEDEQTPETK